MTRAYLTVTDFKAGLDTRRLEEAAAPGSLQTFQNGHINRGGEIVKAKLWATAYTLPSGTFGLAAAGGSLYVFGSGTTPGGMPAGVGYQRLQNPDTSAMTAIVDTQVFGGNIYAVAEYADSTIHHFYDGTIVTDWYVGLVRTSLLNLDGIAAEIATDMALDPDVDVTVAAEVITATAKVDNTVFTFTTSAVDGGGTDDQTLTGNTTVAAAPATAQITEFTFGGTFQAGDQFTITINDNIYGFNSVTGQDAKTIVTHKDKVYAGFGTSVAFSVIADPSLWRDNEQGSVTNTGSGVIDMSSHTSNHTEITGLGIYQSTLAVFSRNSTQIWAMDSDAGANVQIQVLDNIGTRSPKSIKSFGDLDVFFLSDTGVRSLRPRDSSDTANVSDVGTPIDDLIITAMADLTDAQIESAVAEIEPQDGRYILGLGTVQYVFTHFATSKISAWSTYVPGITITDFALLNGRVYGRAGDTIYLLGGADNDEYTDQEVTVVTPYFDAQTIGHWKAWRGLDVILEGVWEVYVNTNPRDPDEWVQTAVLSESSIGQLNLAMQQYSPVIKFKFVHDGATYSGPATLSKLVVHYDKTWAG